MEVVQHIASVCGGGIRVVDCDYGRPPFSQLRSGEADLELAGGPTDAEGRLDAGEDGIAMRRLWQVPYCICLMDSTGELAQSGIDEVYLRGRHIAVCFPGFLEQIKLNARAVLGEGTELCFDLTPVSSLRDLSFLDFGNRILVCASPTANRYLVPRKDVAVFCEVGGRYLSRWVSLAWLATNDDPVLNEAAEAIATHAYVDE